MKAVPLLLAVPHLATPFTPPGGVLAPTSALKWASYQVRLPAGLYCLRHNEFKIAARCSDFIIGRTLACFSTPDCLSRSINQTVNLVPEKWWKNLAFTKSATPTSRERWCCCCGTHFFRIAASAEILCDSNWCKPRHTFQRTRILWQRSPRQTTRC